MLSIIQICEAFNEKYGGKLETFIREDGVTVFILNNPDSDAYCCGDESDFQAMIEELFSDDELCNDYWSWYLPQSGQWEVDFCTDDLRLVPVCSDAYLFDFLRKKLK